MGFSYINNPNLTKKEYIAKEILRDYTSVSGAGVQVLDHSTIGNVCYVLHGTRTEPLGAMNKWIGVYRLERSEGCWGHKSIDETMGPYYFDCPLRILNAASPTDNTDAQEWRQACRDHAKEKAAKRRHKPQAGQRWVMALLGGPQVVSILHAPSFNVKRGLVGRTMDGKIYRFQKCNLQYEVFA